ncbi:FAD-binding oxidoreductase [Sinanaerobacter sp. ZZT-01]|uniref:FAD-binding oxidoreductase n=1 Tax=Sinanaerobacter sp. ZZT-01 TaxID=3111540 RepID=UPI002D795A56|nr:FAD-binding oxidoreductase [Sinanaerobacter sp. ZZT-01]WRR92503.1 FAD-binding oxidoreductase [Sinanaerobacter sp. ZZT-01]
MKENILKALKDIVGEDYLLTKKELTASYLYDEVEEAYRPKANIDSIVIKPANSKEVAAVMKLANEWKIPVVVRGGATGLCGGCTPVEESFILTMERMNAILEIDRNNMVAVLEAGVTLMDLLEELDQSNDLSFPVHPGDEGAQMGGMAVTNAGGARAVRHGVMRKHIMGVEAVLPNGEILELGGKLVKNNAGYNLMQLLLGSEGTLAVITKIILKIYPKDRSSATIVAPFERFEDACQAVMDILQSGNIPLAVEYMDKHLFVGTAEMLGLEWQAKRGNADLLIILSEKNEERLYDACREINAICEKNNCYETLYAGKAKEQEELLLIRSQHYEYIKETICDSFDMAVPVSEIPAFISDLKRLVKEYDTSTNVIAHIADGNVHNDILYLKDGSIPPYAEELKQKMYDACFSYGGTITGEHGIGKIRTEDLTLQKSPVELELMKGIKKVFDPNHIMNPKTVLM